MIRRLIPAVAALALLVACSPDSKAGYKRPTPRPTTTTVPVTFEQRVSVVTDCTTLGKMLQDQIRRITSELSSNAASTEPSGADVDDAKRNITAIRKRQAERQCPGGTGEPGGITVEPN